MTAPRTGQRLVERLVSSVTPEEARAYLEAPVTDEERAAVRDQLRWFTRRYPTPLERLAYLRRAMARWGRGTGPAPRRER